MSKLSLALYAAANASAHDPTASLMRHAAARLDAIDAQLTDFLKVYGNDDAASAEIAEALAHLNAPLDADLETHRYCLVADFSFHFTEVLAEWCRREAAPIQFTSPERATHQLIVADDGELIAIGLKQVAGNRPVALLRQGQVTNFPTARAAHESLEQVGALCPS